MKINMNKKISLIGISFLIIIMMMSTVSAQVGVYAQGLQDRGIGHSDLAVTFLSQDPDPVEPGEYVNLRWRVENFGSTKIEDVKFQLILEEPLSLDDPSTSIKELGDIGVRQVGDEALVLLWKVRVAENALGGDHEVRLYYETKNYGVKLDPFDIRVESRDILVSVDDIEITPERPKPGDKVDIGITIENLANQFIEEIKVKLNMDETSFATLGSANEKILSTMSSGEKKKIDFSLIVDPEAESKVHHIPLEVSFTDKFNNEFNLETTFGLVVEEPPEYIINLEDSEIFMAGQKGQIIVSFSNTGTSNINFVTMEILPSEEYEIISKSKMYLGNLESDDYETAEFELYSNSRLVKQMDMKLRSTYKDSFNQNYEKEYVIPVTIYTKSEAKRYGLIQASSYSWVFLILIVGGIGGYFYWKRRKKKKAMEEAKKKK